MNKLGSNLIFLISQPRAGSTLLQRILSGHPEIHTTAEPWIMLHPLYALKRNGIEAEYVSSLARQGLDDFLMQVPEGEELYIKALREMASVLYNRMLELSGKVFFLDKTPRYYLLVPELYRVFPKAKFVFLLRNPMAVLSSVLSTWFENQVQALVKSPSHYTDLTKGPHYLVEGIKKLKEDAIVVQYENLVRKPKEVIKHLCNRIGIPFYEDMLEYSHYPVPKGRFGDTVGIHKHNRPVLDYVDKWIKNLASPTLIEFADKYLSTLGSHIILQMGYSYREIKDRLNSHILNYKGEDLFEKEDTKGALNALKKAVEIAPNFASAHNNLGVIYWQTGNVKKALRHFTKAIHIDPYDRNTVLNCGIVLKCLGKIADAKTLYFTYLKRNPDDKKVLRALADLKDKTVTGINDEAQKCPRHPLPNKIQSAKALISISKSNISEATYKNKPTRFTEALPKISIITPSYNQGDYIESTITSVLNQDYPNLEYIIIDGGSTDQSIEIIKKYEKYLTYWISEKDRGQANAINKGFHIATGDIIAWLNSDDFYYPDALEYIAQAYQKYPHAGLYIGNGFITDKEGKIIRCHSNGMGFDVNVLIYGQCYILQPSAFINRNAIQKVGYLDESLYYGIDLDYWIRIGKEFDVVVMDEALAAYRWYDEIKTNAGAFKRWYEIYNICRRYTDKVITPGLLVEFFLTLKKDFVLQDLQELGVDFREIAEKLHSLTYSLTQNALNLENNIPIGKGIHFVPKKGRRSLEKKDIVLPYVVHSLGSKPKVDVVLQATGMHAWSVGGGWKNAAEKLGILNRVFAPRANWGDLYIKYDNGLWSYLANPQADIIILLGFDWHSQVLHSSRKWRDRWMISSIKKILYVQESIENNCQLFKNDLMKIATVSATNCIDGIVYTDISDKAFLEKTNKPIFWQPFGVDDTIFYSHKSFNKRIGRAFFRGKTTPFFNNRIYERRRQLIKVLLETNLIDLLEYKDSPITPEEIAEDFNNYQIALNFPSLFSNHPTRVFEAMACGCSLITNGTGNQQADNLFKHNQHLIYYSNKEELVSAIQLLLSDKKFAEQLAKNGREFVLNNFTLEKHLVEIIDWIDNKTITADSRKKQDINEKATNGTITLHNPVVKNDHNCTSKSVIDPVEQIRIIGNKAKIVIDGIIFYLQQKRPAGISRVWKSLLTELSHSPLAENILLLDRISTAPSIPGIRRRIITGYNYTSFEQDSVYLQHICSEEDAILFISTYYTCPYNVPSVMMLHDMIPEIKGMDLTLPEWRAKAKTIEKAKAYFAVSKSTRDDFRRLYPQYSNRPVFVIHNGISDDFRPNSEEEIAKFRKEHGIQKPNFILVGHRLFYKNAILFFRAFSKLGNKSDYEILCTGGNKELEEVFAPYVQETKCHVLYLSDRDLSIAYSGAIALVYPSQYEGFGLPILEAMKSGCPVITCSNSSIPEVAGKAAFYIDEYNVLDMRDALIKIQNSNIRDIYVRKGFENAKRFSWHKSARQTIAAINEIIDNLKDVSLKQKDNLTHIALKYQKAHELNQEGEELFNKGDIEGALNAFTKAIDIRPKFALAHNNLAVLQWQTGQTDEALKHFKEALKLDPFDKSTIVNCGLVLKNLGKIEDAEKLYSSYLQIHPDDEDISQLLNNLKGKIP